MVWEAWAVCQVDLVFKSMDKMCQCKEEDLSSKDEEINVDRGKAVVCHQGSHQISLKVLCDSFILCNKFNI